MQTTIAALIVGCGAFAACAGGETVVFQADFADGEPLPASGWEILSAPQKSSYEAKDGVLRVTCRQNWYDDGFMRRRIPVMKRGILDFEANIAMEQAGNAHGVSLTVSLYNISTWFHDSCRDWRRYFPEGPSKRITGFKIEPVGHRKLTGVKRGTWSKYRIAFDHPRGIVEYYRDNMRDPVHIDYDMPVWGRAEYEGAYLQIGSMGMTKGALVHGIRNLSLRSLEEDEGTVEVRDQVLVFRGISAHLHGLEPLAAAAYGEDNIRTYDLRTVGAAIFPKNQLKLGGLPSAATVRRAAKILLIDMPVEPGTCLPPQLLAQVVDAVMAGADLVVFGGMYAFGKGGYGSALSALLPVHVTDAWQVKRFEGVEALTRPAGPLGNAAGNAGALWYHDVVPCEDAEVLLTAGGKPMFVRWQRGEGTVGVFLAAALGDFAGATGVLPFWESDAWRGWVQDEVLGTR